MERRGAGSQVRKGRSAGRSSSVSLICKVFTPISDSQSILVIEQFNKTQQFVYKHMLDLETEMMDNNH